MVLEGFPRLAVRLRSTFPEAEITLIQNGTRLNLSFANFPNWEVQVKSTAGRERFPIVETSISLHYDCLQNIPDQDFHRLLAAENLGLRGATVLAEEKSGHRDIRVRSTFVGQKGRTIDEAENLAIDVLSLLRYARLLEDRILRSTAGYYFSYEMYYSQYLSKGLGRNRFVNYARTVFHGNTTKVFGELSNKLRDDYQYEVEIPQPRVARVRPSSSEIQITVRIPDEIPMISCCATLQSFTSKPEDTFAFVSRLNQQVSMGHFEVNVDGSLVSFVAWKHLTNDLRLYSLDGMLQTIVEAAKLLNSEADEGVSKITRLIESLTPTRDFQDSDLVCSIDGYLRQSA
jgi:hypothetical protein